MKPFSYQTHYELLEVGVSAAPSEISLAYERLQRQFADTQLSLYGLVDGSRFSELRQRLDEAFRVLSSESLRDAYDASIGLPSRGGVVKTQEYADEPPPARFVVAAPTAVAPTVREALPPPGPLAPTAQVAPPAAPQASPAVVAAPVALPQVAEVPLASEQPADDPFQTMAGEKHMRQGTAESVDPSLSAELFAPPPSVSARPQALQRPSSAPEAAAARPSSVSPTEPPDPALSPPVIVETHAEIGSSIVPVRTRVSENRLRAVDLPDGIGCSGEFLRQVRESRQLSLQQLGERTRIGVRHLENLENDRFDQLPALVYLRGMLMSVARELGLDGLKVTKTYVDRIEQLRAKG